MPNYTSYSDDYLKNLSFDILAERVFCSTDVGNEPARVKEIFPALAELDTSSLDFFLKSDIVLFYEYKIKAVGYTDDDCPIFNSCSYMDRKDFKRLQEILQTSATEWSRGPLPNEVIN